MYYQNNIILWFEIKVHVVKPCCGITQYTVLVAYKILLWPNFGN